MEPSNNVQELIDRLREKGVLAGREEGEQIVAHAKAEAEQILREAREEAHTLRETARHDIEEERAAAHEAIRVASRDAVNTLREQLAANFSAQVKRLLNQELQHDDFLREVVLLLAGKVARDLPEEGRLELLLTGKEGSEADQFVAGLTADMLRDGVDIKTVGAGSSGVRIQLAGEELQIDLTAEAISDLLLHYLTPRFRAIIGANE